jgi:hypothetical protein
MAKCSYVGGAAGAYDVLERYCLLVDDVASGSRRKIYKKGNSTAQEGM